MSISDLEKGLLDIAGEDDENAEPQGYLDTGFPPLNKIVSGDYAGGFPMGRMVEMFGPPSAGKTAIATMSMISAQQTGGIAMFNDHERSFDTRLAVNLGLVAEKKKGWLYKQPKTFEDSIDMAVKVCTQVREKKLIAPEAPIIQVFDSLAAMLPKSKADKDAADFNMNDNTALARATSAAFPALASFAEDTNSLFLFLNQARTKIGVMFGDNTSTPGGQAPDFYCSVRIKLGRSQIKKGSDVVGQRIGATAIKNKITRPFQKTEWDFLFQDDGSGKFDVIGSTLDHAVEIGALEKDGNGKIAWDGKKYARGLLRGMVSIDDVMEVITDHLTKKAA